MAYEKGEYMNIYEKMAAITAELQTVAKNLSVEISGGKGYKAVSERDVIDAVKPVEAKYKVYSYPVNREILESQMLETETKYGTKTTFFTRIKTTYRFVNTENPDEFIDTITFAEGIDPQDKGSGKAITYSDKYALLKMYKISTGEDPDEKASEEVRYIKSGAEHKPTLASQADKKKIIDVAKAMSLDYINILKKTGWDEGDKLTQEQADKAIIILQEISEGREQR